MDMLRGPIRIMLWQIWQPKATTRRAVKLTWVQSVMLLNDTRTSQIEWCPTRISIKVKQLPCKTNHLEPLQRQLTWCNWWVQMRALLLFESYCNKAELLLINERRLDLKHSWCTYYHTRSDQWDYCYVWGAQGQAFFALVWSKLEAKSALVIPKGSVPALNWST